MVLWPTLLYIVYGVCVYIYYYSSVFGFKRRTQSPFYLTNQLWGLTVLFVPILKLSFLSELEGERSDRLFGKRPSDNVSSFVFDYNDDIVVVLVFLGSLDKKKKKRKWNGDRSSSQSTFFEYLPPLKDDHHYYWHLLLHSKVSLNDPSFK